MDASEEMQRYEAGGRTGNPKGEKAATPLEGGGNLLEQRAQKEKQSL